MRDIELEVRSILRKADLPKIRARLLKLGFRSVSTTRRTSVMCFGMVSRRGRGWSNAPGRTAVDIRVRITNGKAEIIAKTGTSTGAHNRREVAVPIAPRELPAFAGLAASLGFFTKVGSKLNENFKKGDVTATITQSPSGLAYLELEIMTDRHYEKSDHVALQQLAKNLRVKLIKTQKEFLAFCELLNKRDDWAFQGTDRDLVRLAQEIKKAGSGRK